MNALFALKAHHSETRQEVTFLIVAATQDTAGRLVLEHVSNYGDFRPEQIERVCTAPDREPALVDCYGATTLVEMKRKPADDMTQRNRKDARKAVANIIAQRKGVTLGGLKIKDLIRGNPDE